MSCNETPFTVVPGTKTTRAAHITIGSGTGGSIPVSPRGNARLPRFSQMTEDENETSSLSHVRRSAANLNFPTIKHSQGGMSSPSRAPGKRQIKPNANILLDAIPLIDSDEDDDFIAGRTGDESSSNSDSSSNEGDENDGGAQTSDSSKSDSRPEKHQSEDVKSEFDNIGANGYNIQPGHLICTLCLNQRAVVRNDEVIQCDKCGVAVHENCYITENVGDSESDGSSSSTEPWFCEACLYGLKEPPYCELCPNRFGAFKKADIGGGWVHLLCALYTPGITFGDVERLSAISWQEQDYKLFGKRACIACSDPLLARTGIAVPCDAALCKNHLHVTCAQRLGLLIDNTEKSVDPNLSNNTNTNSNNLTTYDVETVDPLYLTCKRHANENLMKQRRAVCELVYKQEEARMLGIRRRVLNEREERKRQKFLENFIKVDGAQLPYLPPGFSSEFIEYFNHRKNVIPKETEKLEKLKQENEKLRTEQRKLQELLQVLEEWYETLHALGLRKLEKPSPLIENKAKKDSSRKSQNFPTTKVLLLAKPRRQQKCSQEKNSLDNADIGGSTTEQHLMTQCDKCHKYYHLACLEPPLLKMPKKTSTQGWMCSMCCDVSSNSDAEMTKVSCAGPRKLRDRSLALEKRKEAEEAECQAFKATIFSAKQLEIFDKCLNKTTPSTSSNEAKRTTNSSPANHSATTALTRKRRISDRSKKNSFGDFNGIHQHNNSVGRKRIPSLSPMPQMPKRKRRRSVNSLPPALPKLKSNETAQLNEIAQS
ncbi:PHD finger protein 14 [Dirofilaria immitis]|nr:PHD finger protein 14 [Dirofilaria immitis]